MIKRENFTKKIQITSDKRLIAFSDVHGYYDSLMRALDNVKYDPSTDVLVSVGDMVDRGKQNLEVLRFLSKHANHAVLGNHDHFFMLALIGGDTLRYLGANTDQIKFIEKRYNDIWASNGGGWFYLLSDKEQDEVLDIIYSYVINLPMILEINFRSKKIGVAHNGSPKKWNNYFDYHQNKFTLQDFIYLCLDGNDDHSIMWDRRHFIHAVDYHNIGIDSFVDNIDLVVSGHSPVKKWPFINGNQFFIDSGVHKKFNSENNIGVLILNDFIK